MTIRKLLLLLYIPLNTFAQTQYGRIKTDTVLSVQVITITGATPRVANGNVFKTENNGPTTITNFLGTLIPHRITVICGDLNTSIANNGFIVTSTGATLSCAATNQVFDFEYDSAQSKWVQLAGGTSINTGAQTNIVNTFTVPQIFGADVIPRGPNPNGVDCRIFGCRAVGLIPSTTCTINSGSRSAACASTANFVKNDGIAIINAGLPHRMATPIAPTVTPSCAASETGMGLTVPVPGGATSWQYQLELRDQGQGLTAASPVGSTATGNATLGGRSTVGTSFAAGPSNTFTATVGSTAELAVGCLVLINGTTDDAEFGGPKFVASIVDGTHFTYISGVDFTYGMTNTTATGGTVFYWLCNHLGLPKPGAAGTQYAVFGRTAGSMAFLQWSLIANLGFPDAAYNTFDDYGSPMMDHPPATWWVPSTPLTSPTNDSLVTKIQNIAGNTLNLAGSASNSVTASPSRFDNAPSIAAAVAATNCVTTGCGGAVRFPVVVANSGTGNNCYATSSYLVVVVGSIFQDGEVCLGDTLELTGNWYGTQMSPRRQLVPSNGLRSYIPIFIQGANPGIYIKGGGMNWVHIEAGASNGGTSVFNTNSGGAQIFENVNFNSNSANDYMTVNFYDYHANTSGGFGFMFRNVSCAAGPAQTIGLTYTPCFATKYNTQTNIDYASGNRRGYFIMAHNSGLTGHIYLNEEIQGPITPMVAFAGGTVGNTSGFYEIMGIIQDTSAVPVIANLTSPALGMSLGASIFLHGSNLPGSLGPVISGVPFSSVTLINLSLTAVPVSQLGQNQNLCLLGGNNGFNPGISCSFYGLGSMLMSRQNPTISSGFGTSPSIVSNNGTAVIKLNVGTGGTASSGVLAMPTAANGWSCSASDVTNPGANFTKQSADTTTGVTLTNYNSSGTPTAWSASDILRINCSAY